MGFEASGDYVCVSKSLTDVSSAPVTVSVSGLLYTNYKVVIFSKNFKR